MRLLKLVFIVVSVPLTAGFLAALWQAAARLGALDLRHVLFLAGAGAAVIAIPWLKKSHFFRTFEHETTHLIAAKAFFARMESFNVRASGDGEVRYSKESNFVIALAPYFFPLFAASATAISPALHPRISVYALVPAGFLLAHHLVATIGEVLIGQPDIRESGRIFSLAFVALFGTLTYGCIIAYAAGGHRVVLEFLQTGPVRAWEIGATYAPMVFTKAVALVRGLF